MIVFDLTLYRPSLWDFCGVVGFIGQRVETRHYYIGRADGTNMQVDRLNVGFANSSVGATYILIMDFNP